MIKIVCFTLLLSLFSFSIFSQQDPSITTYMFNTLAFNPAYAGSQNYFTINFLNRSQWMGWNNETSKAPNTQILSLHSPINQRIGLGFHLTHDVIGATQSTSVNTAYAYRIAFPFGTVSVGMQAGLFGWSANWKDVTLRDGFALDPAFEELQESRLLPNFGVGLYFQSENYYAGFSLPRLLQFDLSKADDLSGETFTTAQVYRHTYFTAGGIIPILSDDIVFKPSILIRKVGTFGKDVPSSGKVSSPTSVDLDAAVMLLQTFWLGVSYRMALEGTFGSGSSHDSFDFLAAFYLQNGFRLGLTYDVALTPIRRYSNGSLEIMIGYDFNYRVSNVQSPRYF